MKAQVPSIFKGLFKPFRYKVFRGGRGGGKSRTIVSALVAMSRTKKIRILCCREIQRSIKDSVKRVIDDEIARHGLEREFTSTQTEVKHSITGSLFIFAGLRSDPDGIKSTEGIDIAWVEEAHTVSQASLDILIPTVRAEDSEIWFSYNPRFDDDPVHSLFADGPPPRSLIADVQYFDNPWFPAVLREEMEYCKAKDYNKYLHVWLGQTVQQSDEQVMFGCWRIDEVPKPPGDAVLRYGIDFGFSVDPIAATRSWVDGDTLYIDYECGGVGVKIPDTPALLKKIPGIETWPATADSARPEMIDYLNDNGFHIERSKKGKGSIEDGIEDIKSFDVVIDPRCKETINEFIHYRFKKDPHTGNILPIIIDANNNYIDSLRYAREGARKKKNEMFDYA